MLTHDNLVAIAEAVHADWLAELREVHGVEKRHAPWSHEEELLVPWPQLSPKAQDYNVRAVRRQLKIIDKITNPGGCDAPVS